MYLSYLQFCWECGGPFHTVVSCSRPRITADAGSILAFDDLDKRCASHFLSRQVAQSGRQRCLRLLGKCDGGQGLLSDLKASGRVGRYNNVTGRSRLVQPGYRRHKRGTGTETRDECDDAEVLRIKAEGGAVLADAQVMPDISIVDEDAYAHIHLKLSLPHTNALMICKLAVILACTSHTSISTLLSITLFDHHFTITASCLHFLILFSQLYLFCNLSHNHFNSCIESTKNPVSLLFFILIILTVCPSTQLHCIIQF